MQRPTRRSHRLERCLLALPGLALVLAGLLAGPPAAAELPGGASALNETYQDWRVSCRDQEAEVRCILLQGQTDQRTGQRVLAIELRPEGPQGAAGILLLPFGLALEAGVALRIDEQTSGPDLRFSTCLASGCLVPLVFDAKMIEMLRAGMALKINAAVNETGQPVVFSISLKGFSAALSRTRELAP